MEEEIKNHIESWKKQCGYDIPFDYVGLDNIIDKQLSKGVVNVSCPEKCTKGVVGYIKGKEVYCMNKWHDQ